MRIGYLIILYIFLNIGVIVWFFRLLVFFILIEDYFSRLVYGFKLVIGFVM